jgi:uncharacterized membrane protein
MRNTVEENEEAKETGRTEAFSDGVFAVAITLLVLEIHTPETITSNGQLWKFFLDAKVGESLLAFVTSFATIGVMWLNHHRIFTYIKRIDNTLLSLNLLLLLIIVFIPYPTSLVALSLTDSRAGANLPTIIYASTSFLMALGFNFVWRYASHNNRLIAKKADPEGVAAISRQYRYGPLVYLFVIALALIYPLASIIASLLLAIFFAIPGRAQPGSPPASS